MTKEQENRKHLPEEQQKKIAASIQDSLAKYEEIRAINKIQMGKRKAFKARYHEGNEFLKKGYKDNHLFGVFGLGGGFAVSYVLVPMEVQTEEKDFVDCVLGYSIKAPTDDYREHIAKGLCGYQIKHTSKYSIPMRIPKLMLELVQAKCDTSILHTTIIHTLKANIYLQVPGTPKRLANHLRKEMLKVFVKNN